jgi:ribosomal protein L36
LQNSYENELKSVKNEMVIKKIKAIRRAKRILVLNDDDKRTVFMSIWCNGIG